MEMKEEWLMPGAIVPVDVETTAALVAKIKRLIAAAPKLLMLVRHIVDHHEPGALDMLFGSGCSDHAKQVLAKVDGIKTQGATVTAPD